MPSIEPWVWRLVYPGTEFVFGDKGTGPYFLTAAPDLGEREFTTQDVTHPGGDGTVFGRDTLPGRAVSLELGVKTEEQQAGLASLEALAAAWRGDSIRSIPGAVAELQVSRPGGVERVAYGRPRRFASVLEHAQVGYSGATVQFQTVDDLWYDTALSSGSVPIVAATTGGLVSPLISPLTTLTGGPGRAGFITVGGDAPTAPVITITGQVGFPWVQVTDQWKVTFNTHVASDQILVADLRPWVRTVMRDNAHIAGSWRSDTLMSQTRLAPGSYEVVFGGVSDGSATCTVAWRNAWHSV